MPAEPILYSFRRCPYAMRARMAVAIANVPVRLREVILKDKPEEMIAASPKGTVPVLVEDGTVIDESLSIMRWALEKKDPEGWLTGAEDCAALIAENDGPFKDHLDRYKYATRYEDADPLAHRTAALSFIEKLEARLSDNTYLSGAERSFGDIAIFPFIRQFRIANENWFDAAPFSCTQRWLKTLTQSALFQSVMKKYPPWKETHEEFDFLDIA